MAQDAHRRGDVLGGLSAMLVAVPSSVAFGLMVYAPLGGEAAAQGAVVGMLGSVVLGVAAAALGGTARLITAPCAPAAAVLAGVTALWLEDGVAPARVLPLLGVLGLGAGLLQVLFGVLKGGRFIKYIPYPVVAGYLAGVGLTILVNQLPRALGAPSGVTLRHLGAAGLAWPAAVVAVTSALVMLGATRWLPRVPAPLLALVMGVVVHQALQQLTGPQSVAVVSSDLAVWEAAVERWGTVTELQAHDLSLLVVPGLTLAALLSLDTLKTCVVLDALTDSRHDSNRELRGQGAANVLSALLGGMPGAGTMGPTLVNLHGGGRTRASGMMEGLWALLALLLLRPLVGAIPPAALAGMMLVVGARMVDADVFALARSPSTRLDFAVVTAVAATAVMVGLVTAAGVGLALCILLFVREQMQGSVVRHTHVGVQVHSKRRRLMADTALLTTHGNQRVVVELQGNLFFGTTDQVMTTLTPLLQECRWLVLDFRRVQSIDFSGAHLLETLEKRLHARQGTLVLAELPARLPTGINVRRYLEDVGLGRGHDSVKVMSTLEDALEWTEDQLLAAHGRAPHGRQLALAAHEIELFQQFPPDVLVGLLRGMTERTVPDGETIFRRGDAGDALYFVRRGWVRVELGLDNGRRLHLATFGQGDFFGDMAFIDREARSADAVANGEVELFVLSRQDMEAVALREPRAGRALFESLSRTLAHRLREADAALMAVQSD